MALDGTGMRRPFDPPNAARPRTVDPLLFNGWVHAILRGKRLPPGKMSPPLDAIERADRNVLIEREKQLGPIFKGTAWGGALWIYVFGLQRGRTLLRQHADALRPVTIDLEALFPLGFMRQMEGENHRRYRAELMRAVQTIDFEDASAALRTISANKLDEYVNANQTNADASQTYRNALTEIATDFLMRLMLGVEPGDAMHTDLQVHYRTLGGTGMVWNIQQRQKDAFGKIAEIVRDEAARLDSGRPRRSSVLSRLVQQGPIDATMLGNVIYMIEMGRHDIAGLLRWLTWFAATHVEWLAQITRGGTDQVKLAQAFVQETLRLEQSERLVRTVKQSFGFEGFFFPRGAMVRVCVWEAHKSAGIFDQPFRFDPARFVDAFPAPDVYAPFGVDRHQCPFADFSVRLGSLFIQLLVERYEIGEATGEAPVRGQYHWEPAAGFAPLLSPRSNAAAKAVAL